MPSIIRQIFGGDLYPSQDIIPRSQEYKEINEAYSQDCEGLHKKLLAISKDLDFDWQHSQEECIRMCAMEAEECFYEGFRMGAALMMEVFCGEC